MQSQMDRLAKENASLKKRVQELERTSRDRLREIEELKKRCEQLAKEKAGRPFSLYNDATTSGEYATDISLPVGDTATAGEVRRGVAEKLGVPPASVILSRQVCSKDGVEMVQVEDDDGDDLAAGVAEFPWKEVGTLIWKWASFEDEDVVPYFPNRSIVIRASTAALRPFRILNEVAEFNGRRNFKQSFPLRDGGTVRELKAAVARYMQMPPSALALSRRVGRKDNVDLWEIVSVDGSWEGFANRAGDVTHPLSDVEWRWTSPGDEDTLLLAEDHRNTVRISSAK